MSLYSETIGSFTRTGNYPLEANYIFLSEEELKQFYSDPIQKTTLHEGLFKIVKTDNEQFLYWVVNGENGLEFKKLDISPNDDFINVSGENLEVLTLSSAISKVDTSIRKLGQVITFRDGATSWATYQFTGSSLNDWSTTSLWKSIAGSGVDELKSLVDTNTADIASLKADVSSNAQDIDSLANEVDRNSASINGLQSSVTTLETREALTTDSINGLKKTVSNLTSQANTNTNNISSLNTEVSTLQSKVDENTTSISQINNTIAGHEESITQINTKLEEHTESINANITTDRIENGAVTTEKIATSAFDDTLSVSGKIAPADVVGAKFTELDKRVDTLALGAFHGYFPDSTSLPIDTSTPGYAYVGLDNPYKVWNFNGELWSDSGTYIDVNDVDEEDITRNTEGKLQFKDRAYGDGMGYVILRKDKTFAEQVTQANTIYEIRYTFDLGGTSVTIPNGCILTFKGGMISNGTLNGDDFHVAADLVKVFNGITFTGKCIKNIYELDWFVGNKNSFCDLTSSKNDSTAEVQAAFDSGVMNLHISNQFYYYISSTLVVKSWVSLVGNEISVTHYRVNTQVEPSFYTDQAITILKVLGDSDSKNKVQKEIILDNVHFRHYGAIGENDYHMDVPVVFVTNGTGASSNVWGVNLNVNIYVGDKYISSLKTYMCGYTGIEIYADHNSYFTYININGRINNCRRGVYIHKSSGSWITDVRLGFDSICVWGGQIDASPVRLTGSHQTNIQLTEQEVNDNPYYFIVQSGVSTAMIWDINQSNTKLPTPLYNVKSAFYANQNFYDFVTNSNLTNPENSILPPGNNVQRWKRENEWQIISMGSNILEKVFHNVKGWQIQDNTSYGLTGGLSYTIRGQLESVRAYNSNNEYIDLKEFNIKNFSKLFHLSDYPGFDSSKFYITSTTCMLEQDVITQGYDKLETCFVFNKKGALSSFASNSYLVAIFDYKTASELSLVYVDIEFCDSSNVVLDTHRIYFNKTSDIFYTRLYLRYFNFSDFKSSTDYTYIRLRFRDFRTHTRIQPLAKFGIITNAATDATISVSGGEVGGPLVLRNVKYDLNNPQNGCRYEHNQYINRIIEISRNSYTNILNILPYYMWRVFVLLMRQNGGIAVVTLDKNNIICSDSSINCKLDVHISDLDGRYLLSVKGEVKERISILSVVSEGSIKFIDVNEEHEAGFFDTTLYANAVNTSGETSARPDTPSVGQTFFDTTIGKMIVYNGTAWVNMDGTVLS